MSTITTDLHTIDVRGPFSLASTARFLEPCAITSRTTTCDQHLHLAFVPDGQPDGAVGACVRETARGVSVELVGADDPRRAIVQVGRILSLDVDGAGFAEVGRRDPVIGALQARFPGLRPMNFLSPYEAAAKFLIGHRIRMDQAGTIKRRLSEELGERVSICGEVHHAFPGPARLAELGPTKGLTTKKVEWLRALAGAARTTDLLDGATIRDLDPDEAVRRLRALPGVGPFTADGIVLRGAGAPDLLTFAEPRVRAAIGHSYRLDGPATDEQIRAISEPWRPYRSWATVLLRVANS